MPDLQEITIRQIHAMFKDGTISCEKLVGWYVSRIKRYDKGKNGLNSIIEINPDAITDARNVDAQCSAWQVGPSVPLGDAQVGQGCGRSAQAGDADDAAGTL